jgi:hypothetical protein
MEFPDRQGRPGRVLFSGGEGIMTRYRDRSAVPDWALLAMMATAMACSREQAKSTPDNRNIPITTTTPGNPVVPNGATTLGATQVDVKTP